MATRKGFTLIELMVVILIVGILAAVAVPIMRGRIDSAKWSEANASAGAIKTAIRAYIAEKGPSYDYSGIVGTLDTQAIYEALGFASSDLAGAYFNQADYDITSVVADPPSCVIEVTSTHAQGPTGTYELEADGDWVKQ
ncbi:MAG: type II secretion system protein [Planctomycetota bacterium]|jgi:prepilin-type N-terminal cleavage/methylation domain-containing protein